jgi:metal-responsive CopG/Arc/MetJ family transcriptional regulator
MSPSKNPFVMVRLDAALKALLDRVARQERSAVSDLVRQIIIKFLRERGEEIPEPPANEREGEA